MRIMLLVLALTLAGVSAGYVFMGYRPGPTLIVADGASSRG
jgi:hypothetical protein